jgi:hypothetical protein
MTFNRILTLTLAVAIVALSAGFLFAHLQTAHEKPGWSLGPTLPGAIAQLQIDYRLSGKSARVQISCGSRLLRSSGIAVSKARQACRTLEASTASYKASLVKLSVAPATCTASSNSSARNTLSRRVQGEILGSKLDFYLPDSDCLESTLISTNLNALMGALTPSFPGQRKPSVPKAPSSNDPRPNKERVFPCPAGEKSTVELPCLEN